MKHLISSFMLVLCSCQIVRADQSEQNTTVEATSTTPFAPGIDCVDRQSIDFGSKGDFRIETAICSGESQIWVIKILEDDNYLRDIKDHLNLGKIAKTSFLTPGPYCFLGEIPLEWVIVFDRSKSFASPKIIMAWSIDRKTAKLVRVSDPQISKALCEFD